MNKKQRVNEFFKELTELSREYGFEITAEGTSPLLRDLKEGGYIEFGTGFLDSNYKAYDLYDEDDIE